jgi:hypothetical protein
MVSSARSVGVVAIALLVLVLTLPSGFSSPNTPGAAVTASHSPASSPGGRPVDEVRTAGATADWTSLGASRGPPPTGGSTMATDPAVAGVVAFGGDTPSGTVGTTWVFNQSGWTNVTGSVGGPSPRSGVQMAWDAARDGVLLYGGIAPNGNVFYDDTWLLASGTWENLTSTVGTGPGPRGAGVMAVDPATGNPVLVGGAYASGGQFSTQTWEFANESWVNLTTTAGPPPAPRVFLGFAPDPAIGGLVLYGGQEPSGPDYSDTWTFINGTWANITAGEQTSPGTLRSMSFVDDAAYGAPVLFDGDTTGTGHASASTWLFSPGGQWENITGLVGTPPSGRWAGMSAWDPSENASGAIVTFGGCQALGCAISLNDTWVFSVPPVSVSLGAGGATVAADTETEFTATAAGGFPPYTYAYNFGGGTAVARSRDATIEHAFDETGSFAIGVQAWDSGGSGPAAGVVHIVVGPSPSGVHVWSPDSTSNTPSPRGGGTLVYDVALQEDVAFGGTLAGGGLANDTWTLGAAGWTNRSASLPKAPSPRAGAVVWYDANRSTVVLFGGVGPTGSYLRDTWEFNGAWTNVTSVVGTAPTARSGASAAFLPTLGEAIVFGGSGSGGDLDDTWAFGANLWTELHPSGTSPAARSGASLSLAPGGGLVLVGGTGCGGTDCPGTWTYAEDRWSETSLSGSSPGPVEDAASAFDPVYGATLLFGGAWAGSATNATWAWNGSAWSNVTDVVGSAPSPRTSVSFAPDPNGSGLLLSDGCAESACTLAEADTWSLAPAALGVSVATVLSPSQGPANATDTPTVVGGLGTAELFWAFGDGSYENTTSTAPVVHAYPSAGTYHASLRVVDAGGRSASTAWNETVTAGSHSGGTGNNSTKGHNTTPHGSTPIPPSPPSKSFWQGAVLYAVIGGAALFAALIVALAVLRWRGRSRRPPPGPIGARPPSSSGLAAPPSSPAPNAPAELDVAGSAAAPIVPATAPTVSTPPPRPAAAPPGSDASEASAESRTLADRILVHLHRQGRLGPDELAPTSVTQAGLADVLGRPQSAFARTLQRLESTGLVSTEVRHVRGASRRLKVYRLTPTGEAKALEVRRRSGSDPSSKAGP